MQHRVSSSFKSKLNYQLLSLYSALTVGAGLLCSQGASAVYWEKLSASQQAKVNNGEQVLVQTDKGEGAPWPELTVSQRVKATAHQGAAVFADFGHQTFLPGVQESRVEKDSGTGDLTVGYKIVAIGRTDDTEVAEHEELPQHIQDHFAVAAGDDLKIDWKLVSAHLASKSDGYVAFEPIPGSDGYTLVTYTTYIVPKTIIPAFVLAMFKSKAIKQVQDTVNTLVGQIQKLASEEAASPNPAGTTLGMEEADYDRELSGALNARAGAGSN